MLVKVSEIIHSDYAAYQKEGRNVFHVIEHEILNNKKDIVISFEGVNACSSVFLFESIGRLYHRFDNKELDNLITFVDFFQVDSFEKMLEKVRAYRPESSQTIVANIPQGKAS